MRSVSPQILLLAGVGALSIAAVLYARATRDPELTNAPPIPLRPVEETARARGVAMIHVRMGDQPDPGGTIPLIVLSKTELWVGDVLVATVPDRPSFASHGFDERYKRSGPTDLYVVPLANALRWAIEAARSSEAGVRILPEPSRGYAVRILVDEDTPWRPLTEVFFTAGQSEASVFFLLVKTERGVEAIDSDSHQPALGRATSSPASDARTRTLAARADQIEAAMRSAFPASDAGDALNAGDAAAVEKALPPPLAHPSPSLRLRVDVRAAGISIATFAGNVGPGCEPGRAGVTLPTRGERYDFAALTACAQKLKAANPAAIEDRTVEVRTDPSVGVGPFYTAIDAVRATENGQPLFPDYWRGAGPR